MNASKTSVDYGEIERETNLETELFFVNTSLISSSLLTYDFPREYAAHVSSKKVAPGDTMFIRWKYNPFLKGKFLDEITLWFSNMQRPIELKIKGNVKFIDPYANPACPSFDERPAGQEKQFLTRFSVTDESTELPIKNAEIKVVDNGIILGDFLTDKRGEMKKKMPIRYYYFLITAEGYEPFHVYSYVNSKNHEFDIQLVPLEKEESIKEIADEPESILRVEECDTLEHTHEEPILEIEKLEEFSSSEYAANNIVFLVDVSGSMNSNGRLQILKNAMIDMVNMMRVEDKISLVSYARDANVLLQPTSGADKELIITQIRALEAQGATSGEKGLKQAYKLAKLAFISNGNNRVYISTDGVFKPSENEPITKLVKKYSRRKIFLSVLGIKGTDFTKKKMSELAALGKGEFLALENFDNSGADLRKLVKLQSKK